MLSREHLAGDVWGGLAAMLVALPASIAFGVAVYAPLGAGAAAEGALAGLIGAVAIGIVAPLAGGSDHLVSAPCAPAAAVMGAFALGLAGGGTLGHDAILLLLTLAALLSAGLQITYGLLGGGTLIKYIPYPVVTGYLSGVGIVIFLKQLPPFFGLPKGVAVSAGLAHPETWSLPALAVGVATVVCTVLAPRVTRAVPAAILGLGGGVAAYFALGVFQPELRHLEHNPLLIGPLGGSGASTLDGLRARLAGLPTLHLGDLGVVLVPALTLSVLLSIDTLKTCVVVDALTRTRHQSNREIVGQGLANLTSAVLGGLPGAGTSGPTLVCLASGAKTRRAAVLEGVFVALAFLLLSPLVAWAPLSALAGVLVVVAFRMLDRNSLRLLRHRSTALDFAVVATVAVVAVGVGLVTASGVGIALAILLFIRDQVRGTVVHRKTTGRQMSSRQRRLPEERAILEANGDRTVVYELEGNLFFGTTDQLYTQLEPDLARCDILILDLRRVRSLDLTAAHMIEQMQARLAERGARLAFSSVPRSLPSGEDLNAYLDEVGLVKRAHDVPVFPQLSDALEWAEDLTLAASGSAMLAEDGPPLELRDFPFLAGRKAETVAAMAAAFEERAYAAGERIFSQGDHGDEIYFVRQGSVRIVLRTQAGEDYHVATFTRGDFLGEIAFLDRFTRSADAVAVTPTLLYVLSRARFDAAAESHPRLGRQLFADLARALALRLRHADGEIRALQDA